MKLVSADYLDKTWSDALDARSQLPEFISRLIKNSVNEKDLLQFHFPIGDSGADPGYDGTLSTPEDFKHFLIPSGKSVWELKTSKKNDLELRKDLEKRTESPLGMNISECTIVLLSSRKWRVIKENAKEEWISSNNKGWKEVKIIDAIDLEEWFRFCPVVASDFASKNKLIPEEGFKTAKQFLDEYLSRFKHELLPSVLLAGREKQRDNFIQGIQNENCFVKADSEEEATAFILALIKNDEPLSKELEDKVCVLESENAIRFFEKKENMVFIVRTSVAKRIGPLRGKKNIFIFPKGEKPDNPNGDVLTLNRTTCSELKRALLESRWPEKDATDGALQSGGSVTILYRRKPAVERYRAEWEQHKDKINSIVPALLAGAWDENNEQDKEIITLLSGEGCYQDYIHKIQCLRNIEDSPIYFEDGLRFKSIRVWKIKSPVDTMSACCFNNPQIGEECFNSFREAVLSIFSTPILEPKAEESYIPEQTPKKHSDWLKNGISTTLLQIAVLHKEIGLNEINGQDPELFVNNIVRDAIGLNTDLQFMISFHQNLYYLAEASPLPFLEALERLLKGDSESLKQLFTDDYTSPHITLLWSLECLAWDPQYLPRASLLLARLALIDSGGKLQNRPINSLERIFFIYHPCTNASWDNRFSAIDTVISEVPEVGWELVKLLLPEYNYSILFFDTRKPIYREAGRDNREVVIWNIVWQSQRKIVEHAVNLAGSTLTRWMSVLGSLNVLQPDLKSDVFEAYKHYIASIEEKDRLCVANELRSFINKHRSFCTAEWSIKDSYLEKLSTLLDELSSKDIFERYQWLFDDFWPRISEKDYDEKIIALKEKREEAVLAVYKDTGIKGILSFVEKIKLPQVLAEVLTGLKPKISQSVLLELLTVSHGESDKRTILCCEISKYEQRAAKDTKWQDAIKKIINNKKWTSELQGKLIISWPNNKDSWHFAETLGTEIVDYYWKHKENVENTQLNLDEVEFSSRKLLEQGRSLKALEVVRNYENNISPSLIRDLLDKIRCDDDISQSHINPMVPSYINRIFSALDERSDFNEEDIADLEYVYFRLLKEERRGLKIYSLISKKPEFYIDILCKVYGSANSNEDSVLTEKQKQDASLAFDLLWSFKKVWRFNNMDWASIRAWIDDVFEFSKGRVAQDIIQQSVGFLLANAPNDPLIEIWPHSEIIKIIEDLKLENLEDGILTERLNMRGSYTKEIYEGGQQEKELADNYKKWSRQCGGAPRTEALLMEISKMWERIAKNEDQQSKLHRMRDS
jgi:hypothetical protein